MPVTGVMGNVLEDKWFNNYINMNSDDTKLIRSLQERNLTYLDMIKELGPEEIDNQYKIHILLLLQDNASALLPSIKEVQEAIFCLKGFFNSREKHLSDQKFKCQLIITIVTILISYENVDEKDPALFDFIIEIKDFLIQIINTERSKVMHSVICKCMEELECFFPGLLLSETDTVFTACQSQKSTIYQSYASLLSLIVRNAVQMKSLVKESFSESEEKSDGTLVQYSRTSSSSGMVDILPIVMSMMDFVPFMAPMTAYHIMKRLVQIIADSPDLLPMTFKTYVPRLILIDDVPLFHLSFLMHEAFGSDLFTIQEEQSLLHQLVSLCSHPGLTVSHRLLFMEWISVCLDKKDQKYSRWTLTTEQLQSIAVGPFDGPDTLEKKIKLIIKFSPQNKVSVLPVNILQRFITPNQSIRSSSSLFRTLFAYINLQFNSLLLNRIHRYLLHLIEAFPHLAHHVLNLLQCVRTQYPASTFAEDLMLNLVQIVTSMSLENTKNNLELSLLILLKASLEKAEICKPKVILLFLKFLLQNISQTEDWIFGNSILTICSSLLQHQNIDIFYSDIGAILFLMMKCQDVDIRVQAKIYYGILTSLSSNKIQKIFQEHKQLVDTGHCFNSIETGNSSFHIAHPILHLNTPILKLSRLELTHENDSLFLQDDSTKNADCISVEEIEEYQEKYQEYLSQASSIFPVSLPLCVQFADEADEKFQTLFGLHIKVFCIPSCNKTKNIEIPIISRSKLKSGATDSIVYLDIYPEVPTPPHLEFRSEFTCQDGRSYQCEIPSINMHFEDLFLPLPVFPQNVAESCHNFCRSHLFDILWSSISNDAKKRCFYPLGQQSAYKLKLSKDHLNFLMIKWNKFRIGSYSIENTNSASKIGIFIPKHCHILIKIISLRDFILLNIMTDDWKVLPLLESYLNHLQSICTQM